MGLSKLSDDMSESMDSTLPEFRNLSVLKSTQTNNPSTALASIANR